MRLCEVSYEKVYGHRQLFKVVLYAGFLVLQKKCEFQIAVRCHLSSSHRSHADSSKLTWLFTTNIHSLSDDCSTEFNHLLVAFLTERLDSVDPLFLPSLVTV